MKIGNISAIGKIASVRSVSAAQKPDVKTVDTASKSIQDDITAVERQKQAVSPQTDISVDEKMKRCQELQQELSSLKTKLRISESEAQRENRKEALANEERSVTEEEEAAGGSRMAEAVKEDAAEKEEAAKEERKEALIEKMKENASESKEVNAAVQKQEADQAKVKEAEAGKTGTDGFNIEERTGKSVAASENEKAGAEEDKEKAPGFSKREMQSVISEDEAAERAKQQGIIVARIENDIVILKGEIKQDEDRGADVTKKKEELKEQEERAQWAVNAQFSAIGQTNRRLQEAAEDQLEETRGENAMTIRRNAAEQPLIRATNYSLAGVV